MKLCDQENQLVSVFHELEQLLLQFNSRWQRRKRKLDTKFVANFVLQLVAGSIGDSYRMLIQNLVNESPVFKKNHFTKLKSIAASSICEARQKVDENLFTLMNRVIVEKLTKSDDRNFSIIPRRKVFAVDGTKLNLPPELAKHKFHSMTAKGHHLQALVSSIYSLDYSFPIDFVLENSGNERACVERHLANIEPESVVIYDRGYFGFEMAKLHIKNKIHFIFRAFMNDPLKPSESIIQLVPTKASQVVMKCNRNIFDFSPINVRIVPPYVDKQEYFFAMSLPSDELSPKMICEAYGSRWKIEELYKIPKSFLELEKFHAKTKRGICQEVYASFFIVSLSRLFDSINKKKSKRVRFMAEKSHV
jgi:hypothetical protein